MDAAAQRIVVIGAGMGGLAAAMRLAHAGRDVTVLERQATPGGKMRTVDSAAGPVDAGPTVLTMRGVFDAAFAAVGEVLDDHVTLDPCPVLARHFWPDGSVLDLHADPEDSATAIGAFAGARAARQFRWFSARTRRLFDAFDAPMMQAARPSLGRLALTVALRPRLLRAMAPGASMAAELAREFSDPRLRQLFGRYSTYVGGSPAATPALLRLIWQAEAAGVWTVRGGMHRLAAAMAEVAGRNGAAVRYGAAVAGIERRDGGVSAVRLTDGTRIPCGRVVFNGDPRALHTGRLGDAVRTAVPRAAVEPGSLSANVWAFAARAEGVALAHHNVFFGHDPATEFGPIAAGRLPEDPTLYVCAQDAGCPGPGRFEIIMNAPPDDGSAPEDKDSCRTRTFPVLASRGLGFSPEPPDSALTTPRGFAALFPASRGSLYGRSPHGTAAALARPLARTAIPGLYLAGGGVHPGAGVPMAALSGKHAAEAILTDLASTSPSRRTATPGGMSTGSPIAAPAPSRSSPS